MRKALEVADWKEQVSSEDYHAWKQDPVTRTLYAELVVGLLDQFDSDLPDDFPLHRSFEREGARKMLDELWNWEPSHLIEKRLEEERRNAEKEANHE